MRYGSALKDSDVELKLGLGFGFLLVLVLLLSLLGLLGQNYSSTSLRLLSQVGSLFDEIVFTREANFDYALSGDARHQDRHRQHQQNLQELLADLQAGTDDGRWPEQQLKSATQSMQARLDSYLGARQQARTTQQLLAANEQLSALLDDTNRIYYAEEEHLIELNRRVRYLLIVLPLFTIVVGILVAQYSIRGIGARYQLMEESQSRLSAILDTAVDGIITIDSHGLIQSTNSSAERLFGWTEAELVGNNIKVLMPEPDRSQHDGYLHNYLTSGEPKVIGSGREVIGLRKDGSLMPVRLAVGRVDLPDELLFVGFVTDITDRHALEASLRETAARAEQATATKSTFLANMSHEIRTPMNSIIGFTELLLQSDLAPTERNHLNTIRQSSLSLLRLINDILDTTKMENGGMALESIDFSLKGLALQIESSLRLGAQAKHLAFTTHYPQGMPEYFRGDPLRILQVLTNLVDNAIKFTQHGDIEVTFAYTDGIVHARVRDTGIGMTAEQIASIFAPFTQADASISRRFGGTGLGTSIARQLVELMGGSIEVQSEPEHGSLFHVRLPLPIGREPVMPELAVSSQALPPLDVLIADDVEVNLELLRLTLENDGHRVVTASNGEEAVEKVIAARYDVVLMDVHMPGTDGLQATQLIRQYERQHKRMPTPIIALTASVMEEDRRATRQAGMDGFASKPLDAPRLLDEIARVLNIHCPPSPATASATVHEEPLPAPSRALSAALPLPLIDWPGGASLWGNPVRLAKALERFLQAAPASYPLPAGEDESIDWEATRFSLHGLRGAAGNLALPAIAELAGTLEDMVRTGWCDETRPHLTELRHMLDSASRQLRDSGHLEAGSPEKNADKMPSSSDLLSDMQTLLSYLAHSELHDETLDKVCAGLAARGERSVAQQLRTALTTFEFSAAQALLQQSITTCSSEIRP